MWPYFKTGTDVAQNLIDDFFSNFDCQTEDLPIGRVLSEKKFGVTGLLSEKTEALCAELNERAEAVTSSYSATDNLLQYIYSVLMDKNHL